MKGHIDALAVGVANALLDGAWEPKEMARRVRAALGLDPSASWVERFVRRMRRAFPTPPHARVDLLAAAIRKDKVWKVDLDYVAPRVREALFPAPEMALFKDARASWPLPAIPTVHDLKVFLGVSDPELYRLADPRGVERRTRHRGARRYAYWWVLKRSGGWRLIEAPKRHLRAAQKVLLSLVLDGAPPHEAAHGFRPGRSVRTFVAPHVGKHVVLRIDLADFFGAIGKSRIVAVFCALGYPIGVARLLASLTTNSAPVHGRLDPPISDFKDKKELAACAAARQRYASPHLPQGAPTSPALANLCAYGLDVRLSAAALAAGASYTRYADDLAFSGDADFARGALRFAVLVAKIAHDEGFEVNHHKTRVMRKSVQQRLGGLVVNERAAVSRREVDLLEATLYNCVRFGPEAQNRKHHPDFEAHLRGRIAWVNETHAARGARLLSLFDKVDWEPSKHALGEPYDDPS